MDKALVLASVIGPVLLVAGLSMVFYPKQYVKLIDEYAKNHFPMVFGAFLNIILGLLIVNAYNVWAWNLWLAITVIGWAMLLKGVFYFLAPASWIKAALGCSWNKSSSYLAFWGLVMVVLGAAMSYQVYLL